MDPLKLVVNDAQWIDIHSYLIGTMGERVADDTMDAHFIRAKPIRQDVTVIEPGPPIEPCAHGWVLCDRCPHAYCPVDRLPDCPHDSRRP